MANGNGSRDAALVIAAIIIILLLLLGRFPGTGGTTSTITTTSNGSTITTTQTFSSSTFSITSAPGICTNTVASQYLATIGGTLNPVHGQQYTYSILMTTAYPGPNALPGFSINVVLIPFGVYSPVFNQNLITGTQSFNYGYAIFTITMPQPGSYEWIVSWTQPQGNACAVFGVPVS